MISCGDSSLIVYIMPSSDSSPSPITAKTNNFGVSLFLMVGVDGNNRSYISLGALLLDETAETFSWVFQVARQLLGPEACAAVRVIVRDEDWGETRALLQRVSVFFSFFVFASVPMWLTFK